MDISALADFLFIPHPEGKKGGILYELVPVKEFQADSVIVLPYSNPQVKKTEPAFYAIKQKTVVEDLSAFSQKTSPQSFFLKPSTSKKQYLSHVDRLKQEIQLGNIYEINYCIRFFADEVILDPVSVFISLFEAAKAPYSALLKLGDHYVISASPELFLKREGDHLSTKPIKGTIGRGTTGEEDALFKKRLQEDIKERTENVMAVDVARNDLSRIAKKGSVKVNRLFNIETFETVHQMVSTVSCELKDPIRMETVIDSTFPMASMTGAPKLKAMELIDAHEDFNRGFYSGAMGRVDPSGDFTLSVIIRSIFYDRQKKHVSIAVGSAITYLSQPEEEYAECLLKANALLKALNATIAGE